MPKTVLQQSIADRSRSPEHDGSREEDLKRVHEEAVDGELEAKQDVIDERDGY